MSSHEVQVVGLFNRKTGYRFLAYVFAMLALAGVVLPILPTTPFVIVAAFFASKGSPAFARWLEQHPTFGPAIEQWRHRQAISARAKGLACVMMSSSWSILWMLGSPALVLVISGLSMLAAATWLLTRPTC
ncbi:MAG: YbaN family protein [Alteromonadaceae bacterium]|nr:YbaN family protein [Alteromonadaceae bacterium]